MIPYLRQKEHFNLCLRMLLAREDYILIKILYITQRFMPHLPRCLFSRSCPVSDKIIWCSLAIVDILIIVMLIILIILIFIIIIIIPGTWNHWAVELVQEIGRRATLITGELRESSLLFQQLSVAPQRGNAITFLSIVDSD